MGTLTSLGALAVEVGEHVESVGSGGPGSLGRDLHRPAGVVLRNDGVSYFWMLAGEHYSVEHDGTGWAVSAPSWARWTGHVYRLATSDGLTDRLPMTNGEMVTLDRGRTYVIHERERRTWELLVED